MTIIIGLLIMGFGVLNIWRSIRLRVKGTFTIGTVTSVKWRNRVPNVSVIFKTQKKKKIGFRAGGWTSIINSPFYQVGNSVPVLYDPHNPTDAEI